MAMAAAAAGLAGPQDLEFKIQNMRWLKPLFIQEQDSKRLQISFSKIDSAHKADFILTSGDEKYATGQMIFEAQDQNPDAISVSEKIESCREYFMDKQEIYRRYAESNFNYRETFQVMDEIYISKTHAVAKISFPKKILSEMKLYTVHPAMLDGVFQVAGPFMFANRFVYNFSLPYELEEMIFYHPLTGECYVYLEEYQDLGAIKKFNFKICNREGIVLAVIKGYAIKEVPMAIIQKLTAPRSTVSETVLYEPAWIPSTRSAAATDKKIVISSFNLGRSPEAVDENKTIQAVILQIKKLISSVPQKNILFIHCHHGSLIDQALSGFFKTIMLENPWIECRSVEIPFDLKKSQVEKIVQSETVDYQDTGEIRYFKGRREIKTFVSIQPEASLNSVFKTKGLYLITGGAGALGFILAEYLCRHYQAEVLLTGRSSVNKSILSKIKKINQSGGRVLYQKADVTKPAQLLAALDEMKPKKLTGIFHLAGFIQDDKTINKSLAEIKKVLAPKVAGSQNLLKLAIRRKASFLMMFSSLTGALGNLGQADYALGNAYMDALAVHHETKISPRTLTRCFSINWPFWREGAMKGNIRLHRAAAEVTGLQPLETFQGLEVLETIATSRRPQTLVLQGDVRKIKNLMSPGKINPKGSTLAAADKSALKKLLQEKLLALVSEELKAEVGRIEIDADLTQYGFDSISVMDYMFGLNKLLNLELEPTIFYEYNTIEKISDYLVQKHGDQIAEFLNSQ
jgi:polyketide synthase PksN